MLFSRIVEVPTNTTKTNPAEFNIKVTKGIIINVSLFFPWGCAGLCGVQLFHNTWQILPLSRTEWIIGNDINHSFEYNYKITQNPDVITVRCYNDDDTFTHHPIIKINMTDSFLSENLRRLLNAL